ncbi:hypothetical protein RS399_21695 [Bacillus inaquosorum]|nr:hypothetical protein [Bacillus inaquosorum]WNW24255.1 hypothetical protein RS399_21695 [Bacillus inaquosorum]
MDQDIQFLKEVQNELKTNRTFDIHSFIKWFDEFEVIGNIYEDLELIESK